jgi:electron transport complex protein RnfE
MRIGVLIEGIWKNNGVFKQVLGTCPTLAVSTTVKNGIGMGLATTFVLICSNIVIAMIRNFIPSKVRIPVFIVVISSFVTIVDLAMNAYFHDLHKILGLFIPLIVVNCIILGRAESFASKNSIGDSLMDGIGIGIGFTLALSILGAIREILGSGSILGIPLFGSSFNPVIVMVMPPGAFIGLGFIMFFINYFEKRRKA